ncbi:hypothetical protein PC129_g13235 [Phytophthora cactorum]|uniref:Uncharacterized protein n=2 Tax=Phytophthora cactorum TaxID=29920 RepID=A0A8T1LD21_9STRA|nr:hypothetical protein Pcac1_g4417 [Phytophthora cactorum]KAG2877902.1 hypothetical protein PC114_g23408 [Phytophthora cactorum]KAG2895691.1 hypothetical protein PC117_g23204 [Phytophthora cactorum]KAG2973332.1 hypothetical protein PC119_g22934 [Phytophthora cactorum]KAG3182988.1 hypothetical protein C6341_g5677 [Phytophthora cactorum]
MDRKMACSLLGTLSLSLLILFVARLRYWLLDAGYKLGSKTWGSCSTADFDVVGWSPDTPHQLASHASSTESESAELSCCQSSEVTLPPGSQVCVDSYGIPLDVHHYRQIGKQDNVWDVLGSH